MKHGESKAVTLLFITIALLGVVGFLVIGKEESELDEANTLSLPNDLKNLRDNAKTDELNKNYSEAIEKWDKLINELEGKLDEAKQARGKAEEKASEPKVKSGETIEILEPSVGKDPENITEENLVKFYPEGKTVRSVALLDLTGKGTNKNWSIEAQAHFAYESQFVGETYIAENTGTRVVFNAELKNVQQNLVISDHSLRLAPIESPILTSIWTFLESQVLNTAPLYHVAKRATDLLTAVDPGAKRTLTFFYNRVKEYGFDPFAGDEARYVAMIDELAKHRVELNYVPGFGVNRIKLLNGKAIPEDVLQDLAKGSALLMDYVMGEVLHIKVGETFEVQAQDVWRMIGLRYDMDVKGSLKLRRLSDIDGMAVMEVIGGEIATEANIEGEMRRGNWRPIEGKVKYDKKSLLITLAQIKWKAGMDWVSEDHLLFETKDVRDLSIDSYYEANIVK